MVIRKTIKKARAKRKPMALSILWKILVRILRNAPQLSFPCKEYIGSEFKSPVHFNDKTIMCLTCASLAYEERAIRIGKFRVFFCLCFRSKSKCEAILVKMTLMCMKMKLLAQLIFVWKVSHLDSFCNRGTRIFEWPIDWLIN